METTLHSLLPYSCQSTLKLLGVYVVRRQLKRTEVPEGGHPTDNTWVRPHSAHPSRTLPSGVAPGTTRPKSAMVVPNKADQPKSGSGLSWMELQEDTKSVRSVSTEVATQTGGELLIDYDPVSELDDPVTDDVSFSDSSSMCRKGSSTIVNIIKSIQRVLFFSHFNHTKGPSININVHRNPNNVRKGGGDKGLVRILLLTKTLTISTIQPVQHKLLSSVKSKCVK